MKLLTQKLTVALGLAALTMPMVAQAHRHHVRVAVYKSATKVVVVQPAHSATSHTVVVNKRPYRRAIPRVKVNLVW